MFLGQTCLRYFESSVFYIASQTSCASIVFEARLLDIVWTVGVFQIMTSQSCIAGVFEMGLLVNVWRIVLVICTGALLR